MAAKNEVTGDAIRTKTSNNNYRSGWDRIFANRDKEKKDKQNQQDKQENLTNDKDLLK